MYDNLISLNDVPALLPGNHDIKTVKRWVSKGLCSGRVKLRTMRIGNERYTTEEWVRMFLDALNEPNKLARPNAIEELKRRGC